ncbi:DNA repair exonuclease [Variovorax ureilyticus]|uniref:DNA repair exonuclease n=1 Tax=Variovorax ureilyticus TaxID=1836198 RepID=A0ABU8VR69_9BURK
MGFKFIHAADIHLDSPLRGLSAYENAPVDQLRNASREALKELITKAIEDKVSFVVFAGDLYDGDWRDYNTGIFFAGQMGRLAKAGIRAYVLHGNHDADSEMTKRLALPDNVAVFNSRSAHVHKIDELKVALHGQSFSNRAVEDNLAASYKARVDGYFNIGVLHTALQGYAAHASYAPCTVDELHAKGYDYWALGHVHEYQKWEGPSTIVFPGNLQGRHVRETGRKGAVSITVGDSGHSVVDRLYLDVLRWEVVNVDVSQCATFEDVARKVGQGLTSLLEADDVPRAVRVILGGKTRLHGALFGSAAALRAQVLAQAAAIDAEQIWVEKVRVSTTPVDTPQAAGESREALTELRAIFDEAGTDPEFLEELQQQLQPFLNKVSDDVNEDVPLLALVRQKRFADLVQEVAPSLLAQLSSKVL